MSAILAEENKSVVRRIVEELLNRASVDAADELFAADLNRNDWVPGRLSSAPDDGWPRLLNDAGGGHQPAMTLRRYARCRPVESHSSSPLAAPLRV